MTIIFSNSSPKIRKSGIFGPKFKNFYFLHKTLQQSKFEGADFKYDNRFSNCCPKHSKKAFLVSDLKILIFAWNFAIRQFGGRWLEIWNSLFVFVLDDAL